jgi:hypothetical protein
MNDGFQASPLTDRMTEMLATPDVERQTISKGTSPAIVNDMIHHRQDVR